MQVRRQLHRLDSGLRLVTLELPHLHSVSVVMYARVGSRYEEPRDNGLSHFLEHMLFRGTERLPDAYAVSRAIEAIGGTLYAETGRDYSLYQIRLHPESLAEGISLFGEIFRGPRFCDIEVERKIIVEEMLEDIDEDGTLVNIDDIARRLVWPDHPLGQRITGPLENVERFSGDDLRRHFRRFYGARNMVLAIAGPIDAAAAKRRVSRAFARMPAGEAHQPLAPVDGQRAPQLAYVKSEGSQTSAQILFRGLPEAGPDYPALIALARIIDDGMSTRLHRRLLDELGLAYYVAGSLEHLVDTGLYEIDATAGHANVPALVRESLALLGRLRDEPPSGEELAKAKRRYRWDLSASLDDPDALASWLGGTELFFPPTTLEEKLARIERVTAADVQAVARKIFRPERMTVACVGVLSKKRVAEIERAVKSFR
jgi:predicted Zn-dependent peptidase